MEPAGRVDARRPLVGRDDALALIGHVLGSRKPGVVVLVGRPGFGKSRLLAAAGRQAAANGLDVRRLEPAGAGTDDWRWRAGISAPLAPGHTAAVVLVDDVDRLPDDDAAALVTDIEAAGVHCVVTCGTRSPLPRPFRTLVGRGAALLTLGELGPIAVDELARAALSPSIRRSLTWWIWHSAAGRPHLVVELVDTLGRRPDAVAAVPPPDIDLDQLGHGAHDGISDESVAVLEAVAVLEPVPLAVADRTFPARSVAELDEHHLLSLTGSDPPGVCVAVPLLAEVLRRRVDPARAAALVADALAHGDGADGDDSAAARWRHRLGVASPVDVAALAAGHLARGEVRLAEAVLAGAAPSARPPQAAALEATCGRARQGGPTPWALTAAVELDAGDAGTTVAAAAHLLGGAVRRARAELTVPVQPRPEAPWDRHDRALLDAVLRALEGDVDAAVDAAHECLGAAVTAGVGITAAAAGVVGATLELLGGGGDTGRWLDDVPAGTGAPPGVTACRHALDGVSPDGSGIDVTATRALLDHGPLGAWTLAALLVALGRGAARTPDAASLVTEARTADAPLVQLAAAYAAAMLGVDPGAGDHARRLASGCDAPLFDVLARTVEAVATGDPGRIAESLRAQQRCGLSPPRVGVPLTARERDVARLITTGLASKEIATALGVSRRTVDNTLQRMYRKLGVTDRHQLRMHPTVQLLGEA